MAPSSRRAAGAGPSSGKSGKRAPGRRAGRGTSGGARRVPGPAEKTGSRTPRRRPTSVPTARRHSTPVSSPAGRTTSGGQLKKKTPAEGGGKRDIAHEETAATLPRAAQGGEQIGFRCGIRLHSVRQCGGPHPPVPREPRGHELAGFAAGVIGIEADGDEAQRRAVCQEKADLFLADRGAHQG